MTCRLNCPFTSLTTERATAIEVGEPPNEPRSAFHIGELIDNELQFEGIDADIFTDASHLRHPLSVAQEKVLLPIDGLQQRLLAFNFA